MKGNKFCPIWKSLEQRLAGRITPRQLQQDLGKVFNITIGRPLSLRERNGTINAGGGVSPRADILRNALSTKWMDLRSKKSLTEYYESGALQAQRLRPFLHADDSVLEYGVGVGRLATHLRPYCRQLTGCDINPLMIQYGTLLCPEVRFYLLDQIPATPQFDFCYSVAVFFHMDPAGHEAALRYVQGRLKPGGKFLVDLKLGERTRPVSRWRGSTCLADRTEFASLCERYFAVERVQLFNDAFLLTRR